MTVSATARIRMSEVARAELIDAIERDSIGNATLFSEEFAERHGLNPVSVRSRISQSAMANTAAMAMMARR